MWFCGDRGGRPLHLSLETLPEHVPGPSLTHQAFLFVSDGPCVMPHEAHGEEEVDDGEDSVQPKEVIAKEDITCCQGWASQQKGWVAGLRQAGSPSVGTLSRVNSFASSRGHVGQWPSSASRYFGEFPILMLGSKPPTKLKLPETCPQHSFPVLTWSSKPPAKQKLPGPCLHHSPAAQQCCGVPSLPQAPEPAFFMVNKLHTHLVCRLAIVVLPKL